MANLQVEQLGQWYQAYGPELVLYARQLSPSQPAEDIVHEAFVKLMRLSRPPDNVRAWLYRVVRKTSISWFRRLRCRSLQIHAQTDDLWFDPHPDDRIDAQHAQRLLETLPREQREMVVLRIWGQMSLREISTLVKKPVSTVHRMYQAALETLREKWEVSSCNPSPDSPRTNKK